MTLLFMLWLVSEWVLTGELVTDWLTVMKTVKDDDVAVMIAWKLQQLESIHSHLIYCIVQISGILERKIPEFWDSENARNSGIPE